MAVTGDTSTATAGEFEEEQTISKSEALRLKTLSDQSYTSSDLKAALKYATRAHRLCPTLSGVSELLTAVKILTEAPHWYKILNLEPFSHINSIKKQYKNLALILHPDKNSSVASEDAFKLLNEAFSVLNDKVRRKEYDMKLRIEMQDEAVECGRGAVSVETFWTACSGCRLLHEFERKYLGHSLMCPNCKKSFEAVEVVDDDDDVVLSGLKRKMSSVGDVMKRSERFKKSGGLEHEEVVVNGGRKNGKVVNDDDDMMTLAEMQKLPKEEEEDDDETMTLAEMQKLVNNDDDDVDDDDDDDDVDVVDDDDDDVVVDDDDDDDETMTLAEMQKLVNNDDDDDVDDDDDDDDVDVVDDDDDDVVDDDDDDDDETMTLAEMQKLVNHDDDGDDDEEEEEMMTLAEMQKLTKTNVKDGKLKANVKDGKLKANVKGGKLKANVKDGKLKVNEKDKGQGSGSTSGNSKNKMKGEGKDQDIGIMTVEDSDFYDFDEGRVEKSFKKGQIWALYDDDGMPRHYGLIDEVVSIHPFEVNMSWLDPQNNGDDMLISLERTGLYLSCGRFKVSKKTSIISLNVFSHIVNCERAAREVYRIYPKKGSVWALYNESVERGNCLTRDKSRYDIAVVLTSFSEEHGLSMGYLEKVNGLKTTFRRQEIGCHAIKWLEKHEVHMFSHQIPARKLSGEEVPNLSGDCWELDPASLPA